VSQVANANEIGGSAIRAMFHLRILGRQPMSAWRMVAPEVDSLTNAGRVVIRVPNPRGRLHPGAGATGRVRLEVHRDALVVPDSAIVISGDSALVFVVGPDSIAHPHSVVRGVRAGGRTEVRGDLQPGQLVVTTGAFGLEDGMRITSARGAGARP